MRSAPRQSVDKFGNERASRSTARLGARQAVVNWFGPRSPQVVAVLRRFVRGITVQLHALQHKNYMYSTTELDIQY
jgi:hypothetical protein